MDKFISITECVSWIESQRRKQESDPMDSDDSYFWPPQHKPFSYNGDGAYIFSPNMTSQNDLKIIHVTGTNGKGSTVSYMANVLMEAGYNVGTFTSPYIECFNERIQINKSYIPDNKVLEYTNYIISKYENIPYDKQPSFFAIITLMAFMYFKEMNVDYAIIEVGIGGLLDDTNVVNPILSLISNVSYAHTDVLGDTIQEIAYNKLGIVKPGIPLVTIENDEITECIIDKCTKTKSLYTIVKKSDIKNVNLEIGSTTFDYQEFKNIKLKMSGLYQCENASIVIEGVRYLNKLGANISTSNLMKGLENTFWLGRLEVISLNPTIILDGAHNVDGITRLVEYINSIRKNKKVRLILAISANKDKKNMISLIDSNCDELIFTSFTYKRSDEAINLFNLSNHKNKLLEEDIMKIIDSIKDDDYINIFSGSLYFVSEVRKIMKI